jgi:GDP-L-fucose synthase
LINIGTGADVTIRELAETVMRVVGFPGRIVYDHTKPDGTSRKLMDSSQINRLGWKPAVPLEEGVRRAYRDYLGR